MNQTLSRNTKLKLAIPLLYLFAATALFIIAWPSESATGRHYIGILITYIAFVLWITARIQLGNAFTIAPRAKFLVKNGLYSKLRHPVYYFSILAATGVSLFVWQPVMVITLAALCLLEWIRIRKEEKKLAQTFDQEYVDYKKSTWF